MAIAVAILKDRKPKAQHPYNVFGPDYYKQHFAEPVMAKIDGLSPELRALVHEFGWGQVNCAMTIYGRKPETVRKRITQRQIEDSLSDIQL